MYFFHIVLFLFAVDSHDVQVAFFKIFEQDKVFRMEILFEKEDLTFALSNKSDSFQKSDLVAYLTDHLAISINDKNKRKFSPYNTQKVKERLRKYELLGLRCASLRLPR